MLNQVRARRPGGNTAARLLARSLLVPGLLLSVSTQRASAQVAPVVKAPCTAYAVAVRERSDLRIVCGGKNGVRIGEVDSYEAAVNRATGALAIRAVSFGSTRVFLILPDALGRPFVQELTRDLARSAGRYGDAGLGDLAVDLKPFASTPTIGVSGQDRDSLRSLSQPQALNVSTYLALSRKVLPSGTPTPLADPAQSDVGVIK